MSVQFSPVLSLCGLHAFN